MWMCLCVSLYIYISVFLLKNKIYIKDRIVEYFFKIVLNYELIFLDFGLTLNRISEFGLGITRSAQGSSSKTSHHLGNRKRTHYWQNEITLFWRRRFFRFTGKFMDRYSSFISLTQHILSVKKYSSKSCEKSWEFSLGVVGCEIGCFYGWFVSEIEEKSLYSSSTFTVFLLMNYLFLLFSEILRDLRKF